LTVEFRITGLCSVADISIITGPVIGCVHTGIQPRVTNIICTNNSVITVRRCAGGANVINTGFRAVAEQSIITQRGITHDVGLTLSVCRITGLTRRAFHRCIDTTCCRVTAICCTQINIITVKGCSRLTIACWIAEFIPIAGIAIVTDQIVWCVHTIIQPRVTHICSANNPVITSRRCAVLTIACTGVTGLGTVAKYSIIALIVACARNVHTLSGFRIAYLTRAFHRCIDTTCCRVTAICCTQINIITVKGCSRLTIACWIAEFIPIAGIAIVTDHIIRSVHTGIADLVTGIHSTDYTVITIRRCAVQATTYRITGLHSVAE
jgi:hypothetical protein